MPSGQGNETARIILGSVASVWPITAHAQQSAMPLIGFLDPTSLNAYAPFVAAFRKGLREVGFVEGQNVAIEFRWAEGQYARLPEIAAELVERKAAVIVATGITAARAAKAATSKTPIVFNTGGDPVKFGLVNSLSRPGQNVTGVASLGKILVAKQLEVLNELVPRAEAIAFLVNPNNAVAELDTSDVQAAGTRCARSWSSSKPVRRISRRLLPPSLRNTAERSSFRLIHFSWVNGMKYWRSPRTTLSPRFII